MVEQSKDLSRLTALGDQNRDVRFADDAEIAVNAVRGVQKRRGCSG